MKTVEPIRLNFLVNLHNPQNGFWAVRNRNFVLEYLRFVLRRDENLQNVLLLYHLKMSYSYII